MYIALKDSNETPLMIRPREDTIVCIGRGVPTVNSQHTENQRQTVF